MLMTLMQTVVRDDLGHFSRLYPLSCCSLCVSQLGGSHTSLSVSQFLCGLRHCCALTKLVTDDAVFLSSPDRPDKHVKAVLRIQVWAWEKV